MRRASALAAAFALFWLYLLQSRTVGVNSDAASQALQGWDMLHGNLLLRGWTLSDVSFYTTEVPEYALVEAVRGLGPDVVHVSAALSYTLLVLLAAFLARGRGGVLAAGILVAPQLTPGTQVLLLAPDHTGTCVALLVLLVVLDRLPGRWYLPVVVLVLLTWAQVADAMATYAAALPLILVCGAGALAGRFGRLGGARLDGARVGGARVDAARVGGARVGGARLDGALAVAGLASVPAAALSLSAIRAMGGFYVHPVNPGLVHPGALGGQFWTLVMDVLGLFGAGFFGPMSWVGVLIAVVHLTGVALAVWALWTALRRFGDLDRVSRILVTGILVVLAAGLVSRYMTGVYGMHEIVAVLPYGAVLAGRVLGPALLSGLRPSGSRLAGSRLAGWGLAAVLGCYLATLGYNAAQPGGAPQNSGLTAWLTAHGLTSGLAGYWQANSVRLNSGGRIALAPLGNGTRPDHWESKREWFDPAVTSANFVVTVSSPPVEAAKARPAAVVARFGPPARVYRFGRYTIMVWNPGHNLLGG